MLETLSKVRLEIRLLFWYLWCFKLRACNLNDVTKSCHEQGHETLVKFDLDQSIITLKTFLR